MANLEPGLTGNTSQLSIYDKICAFNRKTCAGECIAVSWKNPKEIGTTGREGCSLLVFLAMGGYDEDLLPAGAEGINIQRRMQVLGKVEWFTGEWVGFSLPNVIVGAICLDLYFEARTLPAHSPLHS